MSESLDKQLLIDVARLDKDGEVYDGVLDDAILEIDGELLRSFGGIRYHLNVERCGAELLVRGKLAQDFSAVCSWCGCDFDWTLTVDDFVANFEINEKTEFVDLTDEVRQCIILDLPHFPVCRSDCRGICTTCGKNLNEGDCDCVHNDLDNRWKALDAFQIRE